MPILLLVALFIAVPIAELYVIVAVVGDAIGLLPTLLLLVVDSILGSLLLRSQGRAVWRRFREATAAGRVPHAEVLDGMLVVFGGALLLTPGFLTDIVGLLLLIPPTRTIARRLVGRALAQRLIVGVVGASRRGPAGERPSPGRMPYDVEGTATEAEQPAQPSTRLER